MESRITSYNVCYTKLLRKKIVIEKKTSETIDGNENELKQVVLNLIDNAIKYGADNSEIKIEIKPVISLPDDVRGGFANEGRYICFSTINTGNIIAPEHINRLTERFYRVDVITSYSIHYTKLYEYFIK